MKVLTLKQPWATLISKGLKKYEFRSWKTNYRGEILIHAGKGIDKEALEVFKPYGPFPSGQIVAIASIDDCIKINEEFNNKIRKMNNLVYGTKKRTGYAWVLSNVKEISYKKKIDGHLSLWNYEIGKNEVMKLIVK